MVPTENARAFQFVLSPEVSGEAQKHELPGATE